MPKNFTHFGCLLLLFLFQTTAAQNIVVRGVVRNALTLEALPSISIAHQKDGSGTFSDEKGQFSIRVNSLPVTLLFTSVGFESREVLVTSSVDLIEIKMTPGPVIGQEIVVSATRIPTRILESPVSIEKFGISSIKSAPAPSYYDIIGTLKGVDVTTSSLTYKTYSTRGFNTSGSPRVNQIMDGMDNQSPGLNYPIGSFIGLTQLDVETVEVLPGASSALYGPGGINGTIIINSKNPFKYQGLSVEMNQGIMNVDGRQRGNSTHYADYNLRWAKVWSPRFATKITASYTQATDWLANDTTNYMRLGSTGTIIPGTRSSDPNYDGINVYGDETTINIKSLNDAILTGAGQAYSAAYYGQTGQYPTQQQIDDFLSTNPQTGVFYYAQKNNLLPDQKVSRTGYAEKETIDPRTWNMKISGAVHYNLSNKVQAILSGYYGAGNTVYTGNNRYSFRNVKMGQYKLELRHKDWFAKLYTTQEYVGNAYSATVTSQFVNEAWKSSGIWYPEYIAAFTQAKSMGASDAAAHSTGRSFADIGRPEGGSPEFKRLFDSVRAIPIPGGGRLLEKSSLWMFEGQYRFKELIRFADVTVGGNLKRYNLNSENTIFIDTAGPIHVNELGAYIQLTRQIFNDKLSLSASGRYDKNENFKGKFTPRIAGVMKITTDQYLRLSYQTAYRFPTTSQQYIRLDVGDALLLGGLPWINNYIRPNEFPTYEYDPVNNVTTPWVYKELKPETMQSFELGYKALIQKRLLVDAYVYWGTYTDFLGRIILLQPTTNHKPISVVTNSSVDVETTGFGLSLDYKIAGNYHTFANFYSDDISNIPDGFTAYFNTPKYRLNVGLGNTGFGKKQQLSFMCNFHWQDSFFCESEFAQGTVAAYATVDAQFSYKFPVIKTIIKIGGTNILNHYYQNAKGNPYIGGLYYVSFAYNTF